jgi:hypothetical protein
MASWANEEQHEGVRFTSRPIRVRTVLIFDCQRWVATRKFSLDARRIVQPVIDAWLHQNLLGCRTCVATRRREIIAWPRFLARPTVLHNGE